MKWDLKLVTVVALGALLLGTGSAAGETLQDAVKTMISSHPDVLSQGYNRLAREQEVLQAEAGYLPKIDTFFSLGYQDQSHPFLERTRPREATVSIRQNVFRGGATKSEVNRQLSRVDSQAYLIQATAENIAMQVSKVYLNVLRSLALDSLAKENLTIHERLLDQIKLRSQAGVDRGVDLEQVVARTALARSNLVVTQANIVDARTDYRAVVGHYPDKLVDPEAKDAALPPNADDAERRALQDYPLIKSARADLEARKQQYKTAKALLYPSVDLAADYTWQHEINYNYQEYFLASAMVSFNIFNGLQNKARIKETSYLINEAEEIANKTERETIQSVRLAYEAYLAAKERITRLEEYVKATAQTAEAFTAQWAIGRRTLFDVLDTQAEHINAKSDLIKAQYDKLYAQYRILSGVGKLVHTLGLQWPEESQVAIRNN